MSASKPCPFCSLDTERNRVLREDTLVTVILSNPRLMPGHTLVIPKRHASSLDALRPPELYQLIHTAISYQERIKRAFTIVWGQPAGCDLSQHDRIFMPTTELTIPQHVHIHLRPRYWQDSYYEQVLKHETSVFQKPTAEELARYVKLLGD